MSISRTNPAGARVRSWRSTVFGTRGSQVQSCRSDQYFPDFQIRTGTDCGTNTRPVNASNQWSTYGADGDGQEGVRAPREGT